MEKQINSVKKDIDNLKTVNDEREVKFTEWNKERIELRKEMDNLTKINDERMKEIEKLKTENKDVKRT